MNRLKLCIVALLAVSVSGCASLFGDSQQLINVRASNNKAFEAQLSNGTPFDAPGVAAFKKRSSHPVKVITNAEGCAPVTEVDRQVAGIFWANIISGGLLGSGTDYVTGKMWEYDANVIISCRE